MNHVTEFDNLTKATRRREFDDGLMDYVFGGTILFIGLLGWFFFSSFGLRWLFAGFLQNQDITIIVLVTIFLLLILSQLADQRFGSCSVNCNGHCCCLAYVKWLCNSGDCFTHASFFYRCCNRHCILWNRKGVRSTAI